MDSIPTAYVRGATPEPPVGCTKTRQVGDVLVFYFVGESERNSAVSDWKAQGLDAFEGEVYNLPTRPTILGTNEY